MPKIQDTITKIAEANSWDQRIAQIRLIPQNHGTNEHPGIYAEVARLLYVPHLAADFAYIHEDNFYGREYFEQVYAAADEATAGFTKVTEAELTSVLVSEPKTLAGVPYDHGPHEGGVRSRNDHGWGADWPKPFVSEQGGRNGAKRDGNHR